MPEPVADPIVTDEPELTEAQKKDIREKKNAIERAKNAEARAEAAEKRAKELEDAKAASDAESEQRRLQSEGKFKEAEEAIRNSSAERIAKEAEGRQAAEAALQKVLGENELIKALGAEGVASDRITDAAKLLEGRYKVELDNGKPKITVFDTDGKVMYDSDTGNPGDISYLAKTEVAKRPYLKPASGDNGTGQHTGGGAGGLTLAELDRDADKKAAFIAKPGGAEAYRKLVAAGKK
jgi:hypothetical protein